VNVNYFEKFMQYALVDEGGFAEYGTYDKVTGDDWEQDCVFGCSEVIRK